MPPSKLEDLVSPWKLVESPWKLVEHPPELVKHPSKLDNSAADPSLTFCGGDLPPQIYIQCVSEVGPILRFCPHPAAI